MCGGGERPEQATMSMSRPWESVSLAYVNPVKFITSPCRSPSLARRDGKLDTAQEWPEMLEDSMTGCYSLPFKA